MTSLASLSRPYARALFVIALEEKQLDNWQQRLEVFAEALSSNEVMAIIRSQVISRGQKEKALTEAVKADDRLVSLIRLLVHNNRLELAGYIAKEFIRLRREHEQQQPVTITTPYPIDDSKTEQIVSKLQQRLGQKLVAKTEVDDSLLAGIRVNGEGWLIDSNMKAKLTELSRRLVTQG